MIRIVNIGMNHETAPVELRELAAVGEHTIDEVMSTMRTIKDIKESIVLSTCNRVEILFTTENEEGATESVIDFLCRYSQISREKLLPLLYIFYDQEAIRHIFRVGSSMDSLIIGEPQILGQVKEAYRVAVNHKSSSVILNKLMHRTFSLAKKIRTETEISGSAVSISFAAVELAKKIFGDLEGKKVLLIGAGEMAELAATYLLHNRVAKIMVANRTFHRAVEVADQFHGETISFEEIGDQLLHTDIVITSTASPEPILFTNQVKKAMKGRKNQPLFFIDIAVPRNIDPQINEIENAFVYTIDDLKGIIELNLSKRKDEAVKAERMVDEEVIKFSEWLKTLDVVPTIVSLKEKCKKIRQVELKKTLSNLGNLTPEQRKSVEKLASSITKKVLNDPIIFLKSKENRSSRNLYLDIARRLFNLDSNNNKKTK
jgi:glutamyl-tRNA reductase